MDLAELEYNHELLLMMGSPVLHTSNDSLFEIADASLVTVSTTPLVESSRMRVEESSLPVVEYHASEDREFSSPLFCSPLAVIEPVTCSSSIVEEIGTSQDATSQWVKEHYRGFCRLVGFPIGSHEQQCLDLLQRIEAERYQYKCSKKMKKSVKSIRKGERELRNLVSSINYDGRLTGC